LNVEKKQSQSYLRKTNSDHHTEWPYKKIQKQTDRQAGTTDCM